jgi:energy-coupling factor transport system ATP-binding protein
MALLIATHDVELAARLADRTIILSDGRVVAEGPTHDVLTGSALFAPQVARLFPGRRWLSVEEALAEWPATKPGRG